LTAPFARWHRFRGALKLRPTPPRTPRSRPTPRLMRRSGVAGSAIFTH